MKRNQTTKIIVTLGFLLLLVATAASSAIATPGYSGGVADECGASGCHDTQGTLTIASNSTDLDAVTGEPFVLLLEGGNGAEWITILTAWADNSEFAVSEQTIEDGSTNDTNAASGAISVEVTFIPLSAGDYTIRIWTAAGSDLASSLDIAVTVTGEAITTTTPTPTATVDLLGTWRNMMIIVPVVTGVILFILGIVVFKKNE